MKLEKLIQDFLIKKSQNIKVDRKKLFTSYVSLFLVSAVLITATFSWFTQKDSASLDTTAITLNATAGMRVNSGDELSGQIKLADNLKLAEASSVDGRNMYFPASESFTTTTSDMFFREGNAGDKNVKYYYKDFTLTSDSGDTDVYVKDFLVQVGDNVYSTDLQENNTQTTVDCPIRIAFILDSSEAPIVIDPTAALDQYATTYEAVSNTANDGTPIISESKAHSFARYYYFNNTPIFTIKDGEQLDVTMVAWLEGGDLIKNGSNQGSICQNFVGQSVSIMVNFETNWDNMDTIEFVDDTVGDNDTSVKHWINTDNCIVTMSYIDPKTGRQKTLAMQKSANYETDYTWKAALPSSVITNIRFNRYDPKTATVWNAWYTQVGIESIYPDMDTEVKKIIQEYRTKKLDDGNTYRSLRYVARGGNGQGEAEAYRPYPCKGEWIFNSEYIKPEGELITTTSSDWYLCSDSELKLTPKLGEDNIFQYTLQLNKAQTYSFNFKKAVTRTVTNKNGTTTETTTTLYGGSGEINGTVENQSLAQDNNQKFILNATKTAYYTILLDANDPDNCVFTVTVEETLPTEAETTSPVEETTSAVKPVTIGIYFNDKSNNSGAGEIYKYCNDSNYRVYVVITNDNTNETCIDYSGSSHNYISFENVTVNIGGKLLRLEVKNNTTEKVEKIVELNKTIENNGNLTCNYNQDGSINWN